MSTPNFWGFRINWRNEKAFEFLKKEIQENRLRQGWGFDERQELPHPTLDQGERANLPIYQKVKKGDYLLIPHVPSYPYVTIVQASEDFDTGYKFDIDAELKDYGHIFPVETVKTFARGNQLVHPDIRSSLRNPMRFWCMSRYGTYIQQLIQADKDDLLSYAQIESRASDNLQEAIYRTLDEAQLQENVRVLFEQSFQSSEWEYALRYALDILFPNYIVERIGGKSEKEHGCDLAVFIPGIIPEKGYVIGIQIKDYKNRISESVIKQIEKAEDYDWNQKNAEYKLIDKYLIIIDTDAEKNANLNNAAVESGVHVLYRNDVLRLLSRAAKVKMAKNI